MSPSDIPCPVCKAPVDARSLTDKGTYFGCSQCGPFGLTRHAEVTLPGLLTSPRKVAVLSYGIRTTQPEGRETNLFDSDRCKRIIDTDVLPTPHEQADSLIRWLGENLSGPGQRLRTSFAAHGASIGVQSDSAFAFVLGGLIESGLVQGDRYIDGTSDITLTFTGWERFEQLRRGMPSGRKAFMAMQYGDPTLDRLVNEHFRVAVGQTGFELRRLDDEPQAGLIDDRLRIEIQSARFLIVDLTHGNRGAYWEAGYAEGLGKPVIYTCQHSKFGEVSHFDTNHHLHVLWDENAVNVAMEKLKATIRATIPDATRDS